MLRRRVWAAVFPPRRGFQWSWKFWPQKIVAPAHLSLFMLDAIRNVVLEGSGLDFGSLEGLATIFPSFSNGFWLVSSNWSLHCKSQDCSECQVRQEPAESRMHCPGRPAAKGRGQRWSLLGDLNGFETKLAIWEGWELDF